MNKNRNSMVLGCLLVGACLAPLAAQASPVTMTLTGVEGSNLSGVYTDPYFATIGNVKSVPIYCDDYFDDVAVGHTWQANVTNLSMLSSTSALTSLMFDTTDAATQEKDYMAAAWLVEQIAGLNQGISSEALEAEQDSYAIWRIFDPNALSALSSANSAAAWGDYNLAFTKTASDTPSDFSNIDVYTPIPSTPGHAGSQEYLTVNTPEPGTLGLFAAALAALGFTLTRRRRLARQA